MKEQGSKKSYSEKLKDPRWLELRKEIIKDRGNKCQLCNGKDLKLHVHHLKYSGEPWEIDKSDLVVLCSYHHKMIHNKLKPIKLIPIKPLIYHWLDDFKKRQNIDMVLWERAKIIRRN